MSQEGTYAKILADSISAENHESIITVYVRFPRIIEPEVLRHRSLSFSAASSRAMNASGHIKKVTGDMFIPKFSREQKGMSAKEYLDKEEQDSASLAWQIAGAAAIEESKKLVQLNVHKQHATRLLQPFEYQEMIITGTMDSWRSFSALRCPLYYVPGLEGDFYHSLDEVDRVCKKFNLLGFDKNVHNASQAQPEIQELAEKIYDCISNSESVFLKPGEWHLPFGRFTDSIDLDIKINCAKCARISYLSESKDWNKDVALYNKLVDSKHWSPLEHVARVASREELNKTKQTATAIIDGKKVTKTFEGKYYNLSGFISQRFLVENANS